MRGSPCLCDGANDVGRHLDATPIGIAEQGVSIEYVLTNIVWMVFAERLRTVER